MYVFIVIANPAIKDMHKIRIIPYFIDNLFQINLFYMYQVNNPH